MCYSDTLAPSLAKGRKPKRAEGEGLRRHWNALYSLEDGCQAVKVTGDTLTSDQLYRRHSAVLQRPRSETEQRPRTAFPD